MDYFTGTKYYICSLKMQSYFNSNPFLFCTISAVFAAVFDNSLGKCFISSFSEM